MSYYEALADNIRISKKNGFTIYYPPCHICGASVESWNYVSGLQYTCTACRESGRRLAYAKPRIGENKFGGESITYMGINAQKKWDRLETFGGKIAENVCQAVARDLLMYSMQTLSHCTASSLYAVYGRYRPGRTRNRNLHELCADE